MHIAPGNLAKVYLSATLSSIDSITEKIATITLEDSAMTCPKISPLDINDQRYRDIVLGMIGNYAVLAEVFGERLIFGISVILGCAGAGKTERPNSCPFLLPST